MEPTRNKLLIAASHSSAFTRDNQDSDNGLQWSVIVIARNEESNIGKCLESVTIAFDERQYELIFVDSASTDRTIAIASNYDIRLIQLSPAGPLRPSVGRHIGLQYAQGKNILFLDGDMTLDPNWVPLAENALASDDRLAGVAGEMVHLLPNEHDNDKVFSQSYPDSDYRAADHLAGSSAYRQDPLRIIGGFNPFLYSCEEAELGARLRKAGYRLVRLRAPMTMHAPEFSKETIDELFRRRRRGFFIGLGQFVRYSIQNKLPSHRPMSKIRRHLQFLTLLFLGVVAITLSIVNSTWMYFALWSATFAFIFVVFAIRSGSMSKPAYYFTYWFLASPHVLWGLLKYPRSADQFRARLSPDSLVRDKQ